MPIRFRLSRSGPFAGVTLVIVLALGIAACDNAEVSGSEVRGLPDWSGLVDLQVHSNAFEEGESIPPEYTCDGGDDPPPLSWALPPDHAESLVLIVDDPVAPRGTFTHWLLFNIPPDVDGIANGFGDEEELDDGTRQGLNDYEEIGYRGPCPPEGREHRYRFTVIAIAEVLDLEPGATRDEVLELANGIVVAGGQVTGTYERQ
jgi:Raf kinase inhibitor-like YbhB/YbcL family protein